MTTEAILLFHFYLLLLAIGACSCVIIKAIKEEVGKRKKAFSEGYELGKNSRIGLNKSGCVCVFDEKDNIIEPCKAHKVWKEKK